MSEIVVGCNVSRIKTLRCRNTLIKVVPRQVRPLDDLSFLFRKEGVICLSESGMEVIIDNRRGEVI